MIGRSLVMLALAIAGPPPAADSRMTLAEANRLSPPELASRLLGAVGEGRGYVEKRVWGNRGGMIGSPGLNAVELFEAPHSAGFEGLCEVDAVHVTFESSDYRATGDPPHRATDFFKFKRFLMLTPTADRDDDADWKALDRSCARLTPVAERSAPGLFSVASDRPSDAYFAMRAMVKARSLAPGLGRAIGCEPDPAPGVVPICANPVAAIAALDVRDARGAEVARCDDGMHQCVTASWSREEGNHSLVTELRIATDASVTDPPRDFRVTGLTLSAETWVND